MTEIMPRHVQLPPLLPALLPKPAELERTRRKAEARAKERAGRAADGKAPEQSASATPADPAPTGTLSRIDGASGALAVLLDAQEAAQPVDDSQPRTLDDEA